MRLGKSKEGKTSLPQTKYNLNDLRDLESKLALIVGPDSSERKNVELFQNVSLVIGKSYLLLLLNIIDVPYCMSYC